MNRIAQITDVRCTRAGIALLLDVDNPAPLAVAERVGFVREGVMRSLHLKQERRCDTVILAKLAGDP